MITKQQITQIKTRFAEQFVADQNQDSTVSYRVVIEEDSFNAYDYVWFETSFGGVFSPSLFNQCVADVYNKVDQPATGVTVMPHPRSDGIAAIGFAVPVKDLNPIFQTGLGQGALLTPVKG